MIPYPHTRWKTIGDLSTDLLTGATTKPFWIEFPSGGCIRIREEDSLEVAKGLQIAMEFQQAKEKVDSRPANC
jgi:hypothetical protein